MGRGQPASSQVVRAEKSRDQRNRLDRSTVMKAVFMCYCGRMLLARHLISMLFVLSLDDIDESFWGKSTANEVKLAMHNRIAGLASQA